MSTKTYSKTLLVSEPVIELAEGVFLPNGRYPVELTHMIVHIRGQKIEQPSRLMLPLTRKQLESYGVDLSNSTVLGVELDVLSYLERPGVAVV